MLFLRQTILSATTTATNQLAPLARHYSRFGQRAGLFPKARSTRPRPVPQTRPLSSRSRSCQTRQFNRRSKSLPSLPVKSETVEVAELPGDFPAPDPLSRNESDSEDETETQIKVNDSAPKIELKGLSQSPLIVPTDCMSGSLQSSPLFKKEMEPHKTRRDSMVQTNSDSGSSNSLSGPRKLASPFAVPRNDQNITILNGQLSPSTPQSGLQPSLFDQFRPKSPCGGCGSDSVISQIQKQNIADLQTRLLVSQNECQQLRRETEQLREQIAVALNQTSRLKVSDQECRIRLARLLEEKNTVTGQLANWRRHLNTALARQDDCEEIVRLVLAQMNQFGLSDGTFALRPSWDSGMTSERRSFDRPVTNIQTKANNTIPYLRNRTSRTVSPEWTATSGEKNTAQPFNRKPLPTIKHHNITSSLSRGHHRNSRSDTLCRLRDLHGPVLPLTPSSPEFLTPVRPTATPPPRPPPPSFIEFTCRTGKPVIWPVMEDEPFGCEPTEAQLQKSRSHRICHVDQLAGLKTAVVNHTSVHSVQVAEHPPSWKSQSQMDRQNGGGTSISSAASSTCSLCDEYERSCETCENDDLGTRKGDATSSSQRAGNVDDSVHHSFRERNPLRWPKPPVHLPPIPPLPPSRATSCGRTSPAHSETTATVILSSTSSSTGSGDAPARATTTPLSHSHAHIHLDVGPGSNVNIEPSSVYTTSRAQSVLEIGYEEYHSAIDSGTTLDDDDGETDDDDDAYSDFSGSDISPGHVPQRYRTGDGLNEDRDGVDGSRFIPSSSLWTASQRLGDIQRRDDD